jgi:hypothetical protein
MTSYPLDGLAISRGATNGITPVFKFGRNTAVGTVLNPVTFGGNYHMPTPANAQRLRVRAGGDADDVLGGAQANTLLLQGLSSAGEYLEAEIDLAGEAASDLSTAAFLRLYRISVSSTGTYQTALPVAEAASDIVVEDAAGNEWGRIAQTPTFSRGRSEIGFYSTPRNFYAYITSITVSCDSSKKTDLFLMNRDNILETDSPSAFMVIKEFSDLVGIQGISTPVPLGPLPPLCDFGFFARVDSSTASVQVDFSFVLVEGNGSSVVLLT